MPRTERVVFDGVPYRRYPDSEHATHRNYFSAAGDWQAKGREPTLHRAIWRHYHGPIPEGCHIHHRDGDPLNNDIANLVCLSPAEHIGEHWTPERSEVARRHMDDIRHLSAAWHRSAEGRAWHAEHGRESWVDRQPGRRACDHCAAEYDYFTFSRFCSNRCKAAARRASGVDDEVRVCEACSAEFTVNRYSRQRACSRACAWDLRRRDRARPQPDGLRGT